MVKNNEELAKYIANWIKLQARVAKATSLVVGVSGGVDSALVLALCERSGLPTYGVLMPCHSSPDSIARAEELMDKFSSTHRFVVNLEQAFSSIAEQVGGGIQTLEDQRASQGALRSCLRAPTLDYVSKLYKGVVVGTGNRDEDEVTRYYQKRGDDAVDISPIAMLHKSEVYELARYLGVPQSILYAVPSADLWGPDAGQKDEDQLGMTYPEIEKAMKLVNKLYGITQGQAFMHFANALEMSNLTDARFIGVLKKLGDMEITSRHKNNPNLPVCQVREAGLGLVD